MLLANTVTGAAMLLRREVLDDALPFPPAVGWAFRPASISLRGCSSLCAQPDTGPRFPAARRALRTDARMPYTKRVRAVRAAAAEAGPALAKSTITRTMWRCVFEGGA